MSIHIRLSIYKDVHMCFGMFKCVLSLRVLSTFVGVVVVKKRAPQSELVVAVVCRISVQDGLLSFSCAGEKECVREREKGRVRSASG